jgi:hypothetical protein
MRLDRPVNNLTYLATATLIIAISVFATLFRTVSIAYAAFSVLRHGLFGSRFTESDVARPASAHLLFGAEQLKSSGASDPFDSDCGLSALTLSYSGQSIMCLASGLLLSQ